MIIFSQDFVQIDKFPGYYWNIKAQALYSCKSGLLKKLLNGVFFWKGKAIAERYKISHNGIVHYLLVKDLIKLKVPSETQIFPIKESI